MQKIYPIKFLDSYQREDKDFFFGRNDEIESLYQMIFQTKILLIYGTSGTGKTSLILCGLANKFQTYDWLALNIRRGINLLSSLDKSLCEESDGVFTYIEEKEPVIKDLEAKIEAVYKASFKPVYLIFDQFEELYVLGSKIEQQQFIQTIKDILSVEQPVKIILSIREEYLGYLYEFERAVPELLRKKLRVEPMNLDKVKTVIKNINESPQSNISLKSGEEGLIAECIFDKIRGDEKTLTIQLPYLQVFLDKLYLKITNDETRKAESVFTKEALDQIGNIGDVLRNFLDEQVLMIAKKLDQKPVNIWRILSPFVTLDGTKEPLSVAQLAERFSNEPEDLIASALQAFVNSRILRYRENEQLYEIAHDSLAKQVNAKRSAEEIAILEVQRLVKSQVSVKDEAREYFTEKQLLFIEPYLNKFKENDEERDWISKSRAHIQDQKEVEKKKQQDELAKTRKRLRVVYSLLFGTLLALIIAGYYGIEAKRQTKIAEANSLISEAKSVVISDPTLALRFAEQAMIKDNNPRNEKIALKIYYENSFYKKIGIHDKPINSIAISPDQQSILTCSEDSLACLWNLKGDTLHVFRGHSNRVISVAFSPDGKKIITGSWDKTARLWDLKGKTLHVFKDFSRAVNSVIFSPGGDSILISSMDTTVHLYDLKGNKLHDFKGYSDYVRSVAFSPDGKSILAGSGDTKAYLWDLKGKILMEFKGHSGFINSVAFSLSGDTILTGSNDKTAILWNLKGDTLKTFKGHSDDIGSVAFSPDGKTILTGSDDKTARLWDLKGNTLQEFKGHKGYVRAVCFSRNGKNIFTGSSDGTARLWEIKKNTILEFKVNSDPVYSIAYSRDGEKFITGSNDGTARLWDIKGTILKTFDDKRKIGVLSVSFSPSGDTILTGYRDGIARLWNLKGDTLQIFKDHIKRSVNSVAYSRYGTILTGSGDSIARLWNLRGVILHEFKGHNGSINSVAFSPDGKTILTGSSDSTACLWDINGKNIQIFKGHARSVYSVAYSPDGKTILTGSEDQTARLWDIKGITLQKFKGHSDYVRSIAFSTDGKSILTGSEDKTVRLWDLKGNTLQEFKGHTKPVLSVVFSPDGKSILTSSFDSTIRLWQIEMTLKDFLENNEIEPLSAEQKEIYRITN